jgi:hypothetical protein
MKKYIQFFIYFYCLLFPEKVYSYIVEEINNELLDTKYKNEIYLSFYKVPASLMTFSSNGKNVFRYELKNAFDNDFSTDWKSGNREITNIIVTFSKTITLDRILYKAPL